MRLLFPVATIGLITALWPAASSPGWAGVAQILFDTRPEQLVKGGAAVPGTITGVAEVRQPASLSQAGRGLLRTSYIRERTLNWHRYGRRIGGTEGDGWTHELIGPLDRHAGAARWYLGLETDDFGTTADYDRIRPGRKDAFAMDVYSQVRGVALLHKISEKTHLGVSWGEEDYEIGGLALRWRKQPQPPSPMDEFPFSFTLDAQRRTVAFQHQTEGRCWGGQYSDIRTNHLLGVVADQTNYWAPGSGEGSAWQAHWRSGSPDDCLFMHGWHTDTMGNGPTLVGNMLRGQHDFQFKRQGIRTGRRRISDSFESQLTFEYDRTCGRLDGSADTEMLPFPLGKRQGLDSQGRLRTIGIRYGGGEQISSQMRLLWGLSLLRSHGYLRYAFKYRKNPFRPMEYPHVGYYNVNLTSGNLAIGLRYADNNGWRVTGVVSFLGGEMHADGQQWEGSLQPPPPPPPAPPPPTPPPPPSPGPPGPQISRSPQLHPSYIIGLTVERRF